MSRTGHATSSTSTASGTPCCIRRAGRAGRPDAVVDTFAGGATAAKARQLGELAGRARAGRIVAVSSMDVYRHCVDAGVDDNPPAELARDHCR